MILLLSTSACREEPPPAPPPPTVTVTRPVRQTVTEYLELTGNTQAVNTVQLVARVPGYLDRVLFRDGQLVRKGELLFVIQRNTYLAQLRQAEGKVSALEAQLEFARKQLKRFLGLVPFKAAAGADVDNWRYQRDSAMANLKTAIGERDLAQLNLGYTQVTAPIDGRMDRRLQDPGNLVGVGENTVLAQLTQVDPIYVYFTVSDHDLARLRKGERGMPGRSPAGFTPVQVGLIREEGYPHRGNIDFAAAGLTSTTGTLLLRGVLPNPGGKILPGLFARVRVPLERKEALLVPDPAVANDQQGEYVLVVNGKNVVERRGVKPEFRVGYMRVIAEGVGENDRVIVKGMLKARPGERVTPRTETAEAEMVGRNSGSGEVKH